MIGNITNEKFKKIKKIYGSFAVSTTAVSKEILGKNCTVYNTSGNTWVNPNATAVADATAFQMAAGSSLNLCVQGNLSLISDATGSSVQIIVWDD